MIYFDYRDVNVFCDEYFDIVIMFVFIIFIEIVLRLLLVE